MVSMVVLQAMLNNNTQTELCPYQAVQRAGVLLQAGPEDTVQSPSRVERPNLKQ